MIARVRSHLALGVGGAALAVALAIPAMLLAQAAPTFPTPLPVPKTAQTPAPAKPEPEAKPPAAPSAASAPGGARDPFEPLVTKPAPGEEGQARQLNALKLVGVIWDPVNRDRIRALLETPDGLGYYVQMNEEKFGGKVVAIDRDRVKFSVREQDPGGPSRVRTVELKLGGQ